MKALLFLCLLFAIKLQAQQNYQLRLGYAAENNWGNTAFVFGVGYERAYSKKFSVSIGADLLTTAIYNTYKAHPTSLIPLGEEDRYYNAAFLSAEPSFCVIGKRDKFNVSLSAGPTLFYRSYKMLSQYTFREFPDGTIRLDPESIKYYKANEFRVAYNASLDISVPFKKFHLSAGLRTYSSEIPLEFFIPCLTFTKSSK